MGKAKRTQSIAENTEEDWIIIQVKLTLMSEELFLGSEAKEVCHVLFIGRDDAEWIVR